MLGRWKSGGAHLDCEIPFPNRTGVTKEETDGEEGWLEEGREEKERGRRINLVDE